MKNSAGGRPQLGFRLALSAQSAVFRLGAGLVCSLVDMAAFQALMLLSSGFSGL